MYLSIITALFFALTVSETPNLKSAHEIQNESKILLIQNANIISMDSDGVLKDKDILISDGVLIDISPFLSDVI